MIDIKEQLDVKLLVKLGVAIVAAFWWTSGPGAEEAR
jgi:hypothetical protein